MRKSDLETLRNMARRLRRNRAAKARDGIYPLELLIVYITMRCNSKCDHCFCWEELNTKSKEMGLSEIERLAKTVPPLRHLLLTGGEPTLRPDIDGIIRAFAREQKAGTVIVNTNGLRPDKLAQLVQTVKGEFPDLGLDFQVSIDGLEETHDRIRKVPGGFKKALESLRLIQSLRGQHRNLSARAQTVITSWNCKELVAMNDCLRSEVSPDIIHGFELVRDVKATAWNIPEDIMESGVGPQSPMMPPTEAFSQIARDLRTIHRRSPFLANSFHVHNLAQLRMVATAREQFRCVTAGSAVGVVYSTGDVAHCEFTTPFANLSEFEYDFMALWRSPAAEERRNRIQRCFCTHGCFHGMAVEYCWRGIWETARRAMLP